MDDLQASSVIHRARSEKSTRSREGQEKRVERAMQETSEER